MLISKISDMQYCRVTQAGDLIRNANSWISLWLSFPRITNDQDIILVTRGISVETLAIICCFWSSSRATASKSKILIFPGERNNAYSAWKILK